MIYIERERKATKGRVIQIYGLKIGTEDSQKGRADVPVEFACLQMRLMQSLITWARWYGDTWNKRIISKIPE